MIPGGKNNINKGPVAGGNKTYLKNWKVIVTKAYRVRANVMEDDSEDIGGGWTRPNFLSHYKEFGINPKSNATSDTALSWGGREK